MLIPAHRIFDALHGEVAKLSAILSDSAVDGSAAQAITNGLLMLTNREAGGGAAVRRRIGDVTEILERTRAAVGDADVEIARRLRGVREALDQAAGHTSLFELESAWRACLAELQSCVVAMNASSAVPKSAKTEAREALVSWESGYLASQVAKPEDEAEGASHEVTRGKLQAYLRDRFHEDLEVTAFRPLAGGFGKQTVLFDVAGRALSGAFVMRRDIGRRPSVPNDCHAIRHEYPVIRAAFERGFPAPDALWLDTEHRLLPGGDFIVMRRSPGEQPGNIFGARAVIPETLTCQC